MASLLDLLNQNVGTLSVTIDEIGGSCYGSFTWKSQKCIVKRMMDDQDLSRIRSLSNHPRLISVFEILKTASMTYVVHEAGTFLCEILYSAPPIDIKTFTRCALQVAQGMDYLHSQEISFGASVSPMNSNKILVTEITNGVPQTLKLGVFSVNSSSPGLDPVASNEFYDIWSFAVFICEFAMQTPVNPCDVCWSDFIANVVLRRTTLELPDTHLYFKSLLRVCCRDKEEFQYPFTKICDFLSTLLLQLETAPLELSGKDVSAIIQTTITSHHFLDVGNSNGGDVYGPFMWYAMCC